MSLVFFNGKIIPESEARVPLNDIGLLRGYGVFDSARTRQGKPFHLEQHLARLRRSATALHIELQHTEDELINAVNRLLEENIEHEASIKLIVTGGPSIDGLNFSSNTSTVYIVVSEFTPLPESFFKSGVKLITHEHQRQFPTIKTTNYLAMVAEHPRREAANAFEVLYHFNGELRECTTSNIFVVHGQTIATPDVDILPGITRQSVIELARQQYKVEERAVKLAELETASEVFLTATNKDVLPVTTIDEFKIGNGQPGPVSQKLLQLFRESAIAQNKVLPKDQFQ